jgi:hypothetical protein
VDVTTRAKPTEPAEPIPEEEWISHRAHPGKVAEWWAEWEKLPPIERHGPAAEVLGEVRGEEPHDVDNA